MFDWDVAFIRGVSLAVEWVEDDDFHYLSLDFLIVRLLLIWEK